MRSTEDSAIILSAKTEESDKVSGLILAQDDYISKPYKVTEADRSGKGAIAAVSYLERQPPMANEDTIVNGGLVLDKKQRLIVVKAKRLS